VEQKQGDTCTVEPATSANSVAVVCDGGRDVEEDDMTEVWEVEPPGSHLSADHDSVLNMSRINTFYFLKFKYVLVLSFWSRSPWIL
jgi:hypothetical protein